MSGSSPRNTHLGCASFEEFSLEINSQQRHFAVNKHSHHIDRSIINNTAAIGTNFSAVRKCEEPYTMRMAIFMSMGYEHEARPLSGVIIPTWKSGSSSCDNERKRSPKFERGDATLHGIEERHQIAEYMYT